MSEYYWDTKLDYLKTSRYLYFNDDYLEFLIYKVWGFTNPIKIIDFGCGLGYLGLKFLPLLPKGSTYIGIDKGEKLIEEAKKIFSKLPYDTEFIVSDVEQVQLWEMKYDVAICQALLLHLPNPKEVLLNMINCVKNNGKIICIEPHWNSCMANFYIDELEEFKSINLGLLQKLYRMDKNRTGKDGNIGIKLPVYMRELGLKNVNSRVSDCVRYLNPDLCLEDRELLYNLLCNEGFGSICNNSDSAVKGLVNRGLTIEEAQEQVESENYISRCFREKGLEYNTIFAPTMIISYGTKG